MANWCLKGYTRSDWHQDIICVTTNENKSTEKNERTMLRKLEGKCIYYIKLKMYPNYEPNHFDKRNRI